MPRVTEAITGFIQSIRSKHNAPDLLDRWSPEMETQVMVAAGSGEPVDGKPGTYGDGCNEWWHLRVPKHADTVPEFKDYNLPWSLCDHATALGSTGWDWVNKKSRWLAFDFDAITGHAAGVGITDEKLDAVKAAASAVPWVEVRKSTGGLGLHLHVLFEEGIDTANHTEHAALGRAVLSMLSTEAEFDFASQVDACGSIIWLWHQKMTTEGGGFALLKAAERRLRLSDIPANWKDHEDVVKRKRRKVAVRGVTEKDFETLATSRKDTPLDETHKAVMLKLNELGFYTIWVPDYSLMQTKTNGLAAIAGDYKGFFQTNAPGANPDQPNCFAFPLPDGAWNVYRFSKGHREAQTWTQDGVGWTSCHFNRTPDLATACRALGGAELRDEGGFQFATFVAASRAIAAMGEDISLPPMYEGRATLLKANKDGRLVVQIEQHKGEDRPAYNWANKRGPVWECVLGVQTAGVEEETDFDHLLRVVVTPAGENAGTYVASASGSWDQHNGSLVKMYLQGLGHTKLRAEEVIGSAVKGRWEVVSLPFQSEYPGGRRWNLHAPQLRFAPAESRDDLSHPYWDKVFNHCGESLTPALKELPWAKAANVFTGADYLRIWFACILREPFEPLPYMFLHGPENSGKSLLWESFDRLVTGGVVKADRVLTSTNDFNGELMGAILCAIEEKNIATAPGARNRIKDYVTGRTLSIRKMRTDAFLVPNTTHWIQCANDATDQCALCACSASRCRDPKVYSLGKADQGSAGLPAYVAGPVPSGTNWSTADTSDRNARKDGPGVGKLSGRAILCPMLLIGC